MAYKLWTRIVSVIVFVVGWTACDFGGAKTNLSLTQSSIHAGPMPPVSVSFDMTFKDGTRVNEEFEVVEDVLETRIGPLRLTIIWEQFQPEMEPTPTLLLRNTFMGTGVVRWLNGEVRVGDRVFNFGDHGCMPPRYCLIQSALTLEHWRMIPDTENLPQWIRNQALQEIENRREQAWVGPYQLWWTDGNPSAPGGAGIAPYHGGMQDWLSTTAEGKARRFAEAIGNMSLGIWLDYDPASHGELYWWDACAIEYAPPGYQWQASGSGWCEYEQLLANRKISDMSHARRYYGAVSSLARYCRIGKYFLMEAIWPEVKRIYSMDRNMPPSPNPDLILLSPLWQILELTAREGPLAPPAAAPWGNRREAHAINIVNECYPYMSEEDRRTYVTAWAQLLIQLDDGRGVLDRTFSGDAANCGLPAPVAMAFQQQLLCNAARELGAYHEDARTVGNRIAQWWGPFPPYFAHTGGDYPSALDAPHTGNSVSAYTWFTHPHTADFPAIVQSSMGHHFDESNLSCAPPEVRQW